MTFKALLDTLATVSGHSAPRLRLPWRAAMAIGFADQFVARLRGRDHVFRSTASEWRATACG